MMMDFKHCDIAKIKLSALPGASVGECFKEALTLAITEWRNVELMHNDKRYQVLINRILGTIEEI